MARTVKDTRLDSRAARAALAARHEPYWRLIDAGMHIGYRKGARKKSWIGRYRLKSGEYRKSTLGIPDDVQDADGLKVLSYSQAQSIARDWFQEQTRSEAGVGVGPLTVREVMERYLKWSERNSKGFQSTRYNIKAHILPALGDEEVAELTSAKIRKFHSDLAVKPVRLRTVKGKDQRYRSKPTTSGEKRSRKATANKILAILKAALNQSFQDGDIVGDEAWQKAKPFRNVDAPRIRHLDTDETRRLVNACTPDFRHLVNAALLTGCRYGELTRARVADFSASNHFLHVFEAKGGKPRDVPLTDDGVTFFNQMTAGKAKGDLIFVREDGEQWGKSHQRRRLLEACKAAKIDPPISFHILRHCYGSALTMKGTPLTVTAAALGHADTRITERHYGHLAPSFISDTIRQNLPNLGVIEETNVEPLAKRGRGATDRQG